MDVFHSWICHIEGKQPIAFGGCKESFKVTNQKWKTKNCSLNLKTGMIDTFLLGVWICHIEIKYISPLFFMKFKVI